MSHLWAEIHPLSEDATSPLLLYAKQLSLSTDLLLKNRKYFRFFLLFIFAFVRIQAPYVGNFNKGSSNMYETNKRDYSESPTP